MKRAKHEDDKLVRPGDLGRWRHLFSDVSGVRLVIQTARAPLSGLSTCLPLGSTQLVTRPNSSLRRVQDEGDVEGR